MVRLLALAVIAAFAVTAAAPAAAATRHGHHPSPAPPVLATTALQLTPDGICSLPLVSLGCKAGGVVKKVASGAAHVVTNGIEGIVKSAITGFATSVADAEAYFVEQTATLWTKVSVPSIADLKTFKPDGTAGALQQLLVPLTLAVAVFGTLIGAAKIVYDFRRAGEHVEALGAYLARYVLVSALGTVFLALVVSASEGTSSYLIGQATANHSFADQIGQLLGTVIAKSVPAAAAAGPAGAGAPLMIGLAGTFATAIVAVIVGFFAILTTVFEFALMFVRGGCIVLLGGTFSLAAAMSAHRFGKGWLDKSISWSLAFALYKPAAAIIYCTAFTLAGQTGPHNAIDIIDGLVLLVLAVVALPALIRFCAPVTAELSGHVAGAVALSGAAAAVAGATAGGSGGRGAGRRGGGGAQESGGFDGDGPTGSIAPDLTSLGAMTTSRGAGMSSVASGALAASTGGMAAVGTLAGKLASRLRSGGQTLAGAGVGDGDGPGSANGAGVTGAVGSEAGAPSTNSPAAAPSSNGQAASAATSAANGTGTPGGSSDDAMGGVAGGVGDALATGAAAGGQLAGAATGSTSAGQNGGPSGASSAGQSAELGSGLSGSGDDGPTGARPGAAGAGDITGSGSADSTSEGEQSATRGAVRAGAAASDITAASVGAAAPVGAAGASGDADAIPSAGNGARTPSPDATAERPGAAARSPSTPPGDPDAPSGAGLPETE
jgi:type IV secretion system protein TrbL